MLISWNNLNIFKWNNTYLYLYEIMCMKLERHKDFYFFWKDTKISIDIEKKKIDFFLFQYFRIHFENLKHYNL
jgi:hypothetical protein